MKVFCGWQHADGGWEGFYQGGTTDPLVRTAERPFNTGALDTVEKTEQK